MRESCVQNNNNNNIAGGPTCTERYWSKLLHRLGRADLHHGCRITEVAYQLSLSKVKVLLAGGENSDPGVEEHRLRFLIGGVADGPSGGGGLAGAGLRRRCGGGAVLAAFVLRSVLSAIF